MRAVGRVARQTDGRATSRLVGSRLLAARQMDGRTDRCAGGRTGRRTDERTDDQTDEQTDAQTDGRTDGRTNERTDERTDGRTDERTDGQRQTADCTLR